SLIDLFHQQDELTSKKQEILIENIISKFEYTSYQQVLERFLKEVKNKKALEACGQLVKRDLKKNFNYLHSNNFNNPLLFLQRLSKQYAQHFLIENLVSFCLSNIPLLDRETILISLFKDPNKASLVYMILTEEIFKNTRIHEELNKTCCSILEEI